MRTTLSESPLHWNLQKLGLKWKANTKIYFWQKSIFTRQEEAKSPPRYMKLEKCDSPLRCVNLLFISAAELWNIYWSQERDFVVSCPNISPVSCIWKSWARNVQWFFFFFCECAVPCIFDRRCVCNKNKPFSPNVKRNFVGSGCEWFLRRWHSPRARKSLILPNQEPVFDVLLRDLLAAAQQCQVQESVWSHAQCGRKPNMCFVGFRTIMFLCAIAFLTEHVRCFPRHPNGHPNVLSTFADCFFTGYLWSFAVQVGNWTSFWL